MLSLTYSVLCTQSYILSLTYYSLYKCLMSPLKRRLQEGAGLWGYRIWKSWTTFGALSKFLAGSHVASKMGYPFHKTRYWSFHQLLMILEWSRLHTHSWSPKPHGVARCVFLELRIDDRSQEVMHGRHCEFCSVMEEQDRKPRGWLYQRCEMNPIFS